MRAHKIGTARATARMIDAWLDGELSEITVLAHAPALVRMLQSPHDQVNRADVIALINTTRATHQFNAIYALHQNGDVVIADPNAMVGRNYIAARWFFNAVAGQTALDDPRYDAQDDRVFLHLSAPVRDANGVILGTVIGRLTLDDLETIIALDANFSGRGDHGILWDDQSVQLVHTTRPDLRFRPLAPLPTDIAGALIAESRYGPDTRAILSTTQSISGVIAQSKLLLFDPGTDPFFEYSTLNAGPGLITTAPLTKKRWLYGIYTPDKEILATVETQTAHATRIAFATALLAMVLAILAARWVTRPIRQVAEAAHALAAGDMTRRVQLARRDEAGQLSRAFDAMADALAAKEDLLLNYATELEHKVDERTEEIRYRLIELEAVNKISTALRAASSLQEILPRLLDETLEVLHTHAGSIDLYGAASGSIKQYVGRGWFSPMTGIMLKPGEGISGTVFQTGVAHIAREFASDSLARPSEPGMIPAGWGGICFPIRTAQAIIGVIFISVQHPRKITASEINLLTTIAEIAGNAIHRTRLHDQVTIDATELAHAYESTIEGWSRALDLRDRETEGHTRRVTEMALRLARALNVNEDALIHIRRGALLHDIGKMGVPDSILHKPGPLSSEEWEVMRMHPIYAYEMLLPITYLHPALDIPYCHHEKCDGTGYPHKLRGEEIPLTARIFAVIDVWDALRSDRPYRGGWPPWKVREYLREHAGTHFDPQVVAAFLEMIKEE